MFTLANKRAFYACLGLAIGGLILAGPTACDQHSDSAVSISASSDDSPNADNLDQRLVGRWRHTDTYVSGDFSAAIDLWFILKSDGSYEYFKGAAAAGSADASLVNGAGGNVSRGKWRTESKILYTSADASNQWQPVGRYLVEDGRFMVNKVVWERQ